MNILGDDIAIKENILFSFKRYLVWWLILLVTMVFDYLTTLFFISQLGVKAEANGVISWLIGNIGLSMGIIIGKLLQLFSVVLFVSLHQKLGNLFLLVIILLNCWAVVINTLTH